MTVSFAMCAIAAVCTSSLGASTLLICNGRIISWTVPYFCQVMVMLTTCTASFLDMLACDWSMMVFLDAVLSIMITVLGLLQVASLQDSGSMVSSSTLTLQR